MSFIYHLVPEPFHGTELIPLNEMDKESELYQYHAKKYVGREDLMDVIIPKLNCKWNDVVQFSSLDPQVIVNELANYQEGLTLGRRFYFKIPIEEIVGKYEVVLFDRKPGGKKGDFQMGEEEIEVLTLENYEELSTVPDRTKDFWENVESRGGKYLWFPYIPHVLIKGKVETSSFEICEMKI